jgi:acyl carrier protein
MEVASDPGQSLVGEVIQSVRRAAKLDPDLPLDGSSRLIEDLGIDSLDLVDVLLKVEGDFDVSIDDRDVVKLVTIRDLARYVADRRPGIAA